MWNTVYANILYILPLTTSPDSNHSSNSVPTTGALSHHLARLDLSALDRAVEHYFQSDTRDLVKVRNQALICSLSRSPATILVNE